MAASASTEPFPQLASSAPTTPLKPLRSKGAGPEQKHPMPIRLLYFFMSPVIRRGKELNSPAHGEEKRPLMPEDLVELPDDEWPEHVYDMTFKPMWQEEVERSRQPDAEPPSLRRVLRQAFGREVYAAAILKIISDAALIGIPLVLRELIKWIGHYVYQPGVYGEKAWQGYLLALAMMGIFVVYTYTYNASVFLTCKAFGKMRIACMLAIFDKGLTLSGSHGKTGLVSQMHGTDSSKFVETALFAQHAWSAPLAIVGAIIALYFFIGPAAFIGFAVAIVTVPMQGKAATTLGMARAQASRFSDRRLNRVNEFVQGIRIIKFMSWAGQFERTTDEIREKELEHLTTMHKARAFFQIMLTQAPFLIALTTFGAAYGLGNSMRADNVFAAFAMLNVLRAPLTVMPLSIAKLLETSVAIARMEKFLLMPEQELRARDLDAEAAEQQEEAAASPPAASGTDPTMDVNAADARAVMQKEDLAVYIPKFVVEYETRVGPVNDSMATPAIQKPGGPGFAPGQQPQGEPEAPRYERHVLMDLANVKIPKGKLTVVIGPTAGGKSTLINAMVGESMCSDDSLPVFRRGRVAYVPQEAWIMNATLRDNVLMGAPFDTIKYKTTLLACQLKSDLEQLNSSDRTEIGERGINLSGGQKQRVAFARAVYSEREVVLMDDPLSAVDPHVCGALFHTCIRTALKDRTRVLVTHQQQFLPWADHVLVVADRKIVYSGPPGGLEADEEARKHIAVAEKEAEEQAADVNDSITEPIDVAAVVEAAETEGGTEDSFVSARSSNVHRYAASLTATAESNPDEAIKMLKTIAQVWHVPAAPAGGTGTALMQAEKQDLSQIGWPIFAWYNRTGGWGLMLLAMLLYVIWRTSTVAADLILSWWATRTKIFGETLTQKQYIQWYGIFIAISTVFCIFRLLPIILAMINVSRVAQRKMVARMLRAPMSFFDTTPTGRIINRASKDLEMVDVMVPETLTVFYNLMLVVIGAWAVQAVGAWFMPIVFVVVIIIFAYLFSSYVMTNHGVKRLDAVSRSPVLSILNEMLGGLPSIRAFDMVQNYRTSHAIRLHSNNRANYCWRNLQRWLQIRVDCLTCFVIGAVSMISIAVLQNTGDQQRIDFYPIATLGITYSVVITGAIGFLVQMAAELIAAFSSVERVREYAEELEQERDVTYAGERLPALAGSPRNHVAKPLDTEVPASIDPKTKLPLVARPPPEHWPAHGSVVFDNVFLRYRDGLDLVLKGVSFTAEAHEKVGIVGRTGSGKSTIMLALFRMIEMAKSETSKMEDGSDAHLTNRILIDGVDIANVSLDDLRRGITIIPQDPLLFAGTIRSNLDPFEEHDDAELMRVLEKAHLRQRIESEELMLNCPVADRGSNFSAGERQLICLARALLKGCNILLLDEATASIDPRHDKLLQETIRQEFEYRTVLTIAHRLGTIIDSDKVLVLDAGLVAEFGRPWDLLQRKPGTELGGPAGGVFWGMVTALGPEEAARLTELARIKAQDYGRPEAVDD